MKFGRFIFSAVVFFLSILMLAGMAHNSTVASAQQGVDKIEPALADQLMKQGSADYLIRFTKQADLTPAYSMDWSGRGEYVYQTLMDTAQLSQEQAKAILNSEGKKYQTFIAGNELYVRGGSQAQALQLAALTEVASIRAARTFHIDPIITGSPFSMIQWPGDFLVNQLLTTVRSSGADSIVWGITDTGASQFWNAFGDNGNGIVVANIDTGVQWNHPALMNAYKCEGNPSNPACWADPSNICGGSPCDNNGHGTHTMGTMVAADNPSLPFIAGMAPGAQWIACKGCESNDCSEFALNACADWILAPNGNPANRPQVVNNSWGGAGDDPWYRAKVQAWVAAGIFPAFSAGNDGPACSTNSIPGTLGSPGDYPESFASAAYDSSRNIASFSSRGPSAFGDVPYTKPNISAPGVFIISSLPTNSWGSMSGTSMASPHTAGAVALLWSCNPSLVGQVDATFQLLQGSADTPPPGTCGAPADKPGNYTYGYGYLDVLSSGFATCRNILTGVLNGSVSDNHAAPITGITITAYQSGSSSQLQATTDFSGTYTMTLPAGTYDVRASGEYYASKTVTDVVVLTSTITTRDFNLTPINGWNEIPLPSGCPDWTEFDGENDPATGKVFFMGGNTGTGIDGSILSFDPATTNCVSTGVSLPIPVKGYAVVQVNNGSADLICAIGGIDGEGKNSGLVQCFDPVAHIAAQTSFLPGNLGDFAGNAAVAINNKVYIFGGVRTAVSPYQTSQTWEWNPLDNTWLREADLTLARGFINNAVADGKIYAFGGELTNDGIHIYTQTRAELFDPATGTWSDAAIADLPVPAAKGTAYGFSSSSGYSLADKIVIAGGEQPYSESAQALVYDIEANSYNYGFPDLSIRRSNQAGFFVPGAPGVMWVFGGRSGSDTPPFAAPEYYLVSRHIEPTIQVIKPPQTVYLLPNITQTVSMTIENRGAMSLDWMLSAALWSAGTSSDPFNSQENFTYRDNAMQDYQASGITGTVPSAGGETPPTVLWDQPLSNVNRNPYQDQEFPLTPASSSYLADDFTTSVPWSISTINIPGSFGMGGPSLYYATSLTWQLYFDSGSVPDGDPSGRIGLPIWSLTLAPFDPKVKISWDSYGTFAVTTLTLPSPIFIVPGTYWLVFYPTMDQGAYSPYGRQASDTANGAVAQFINPGGGMGLGTAWQDWNVLGAGQRDLAFRLSGTVLSNVPWLGINPGYGTILPGQSSVVDLTLTSTGLNVGIYQSVLTLRSNDPAQSLMFIPFKIIVSRNVNYLPIINR